MELHPLILLLLSLLSLQGKKEDREGK
jgi:hypothetical protein